MTEEEKYDHYFKMYDGYSDVNFLRKLVSMGKMTTIEATDFYVDSLDENGNPANKITLETVIEMVIGGRKDYSIIMPDNKIRFKIINIALTNALEEVSSWVPSWSSLDTKAKCKMFRSKAKKVIGLPTAKEYTEFMDLTGRLLEAEINSDSDRLTTIISSIKDSISIEMDDMYKSAGEILLSIHGVDKKTLAYNNDGTLKPSMLAKEDYKDFADNIGSFTTISAWTKKDYDTVIDIVDSFDGDIESFKYLKEVLFNGRKASKPKPEYLKLVNAVFKKECALKSIEVFLQINCVIENNNYKQVQTKSGRISYEIPLDETPKFEFKNCKAYYWLDHNRYNSESIHELESLWTWHMSGKYLQICDKNTESLDITDHYYANVLGMIKLDNIDIFESLCAKMLCNEKLVTTILNSEYTPGYAEKTRVIASESLRECRGSIDTKLLKSCGYSEEEINSFFETMSQTL